MNYLVSDLSAVIRASFDFSNKLEIASNLLDPLKSTLDGEPILLPIPDDAPVEIPRIVLTSKDNKYKCNVSKEFVEFVYKEDNPTKELPELREQYLKTISDISTVLKTKFKSIIFRLGFVVRLVVIHDSPVELIKEKFIKPGVLDSPRALELNILDRMEWDTLTINRWYRIATKAGQKDGDKSLSVVFDINTIQEKKYDFNIESSMAFYDRASLYTLDSIKTLI